MKKLLLSLAMAVGIISVASAVEVTDVLSQQTVGNSGGYSDYTLSSENTQSGAAYSLNCGSTYNSIQLRSSADNTTKNYSGIVSTTSGGTLKKIVVTWVTNTDDARVLNIYGADKAFTINGLFATTDAPKAIATLKKGNATDLVSTYEFTEDYTFVGLRSASNAMYIKQIEITWEQAAPAVDRPVITNDNGTVTITAGASGADAIYYTTDDNASTDEWTKYDVPFTVDKSCTVRARAQKGEDWSGIASLEVKVVKTYAGFDAFLASDPVSGETEAKITEPITVIYQNGSNMYVQDYYGNFMLLYQEGGFQGITTENGTRFESIEGTYTLRNQLPTMTGVTFGYKFGGTAVVPTTVTIPELTLPRVNEYVQLEGINITEGSNANTFTGTDASGNTIQIYNSLGNSKYYNPAIEVPTGEGFTVTGFVCRYNNTLQITPIKFEGGKVMETVASPVFSVAAGEVLSGTEVAISCATEGAELRYTIGDAVPDETSTLYEGDAIIINQDTKINAIAYKEGMLASEVVSASYTVLPSGTKLATFNFGDPTTLSPAITMPAANEIDVIGETFTVENGVTLSIGSAVEEGITNPSSQKSRIFKSGDIIDLRIYKGWSFTITAPAKHKLIKIQMTTAGGSISLNASEGSFASGTWNAPTEAALAETSTNDVKSVKFTATSNSRIQTIKVYAVPTSGQTGIESVTAADEDAPVEYYNLQGVRVMNPKAGLYIVKRGSKVSKAILR